SMPEWARNIAYDEYINDNGDAPVDPGDGEFPNYRVQPRFLSLVEKLRKALDAAGPPEVVILGHMVTKVPASILDSRAALKNRLEALNIRNASVADDWRRMPLGARPELAAFAQNNAVFVQPVEEFQAAELTREDQPDDPLPREIARVAGLDAKAV